MHGQTTVDPSETKQTRPMQMPKPDFHTQDLVERGDVGIVLSTYWPGSKLNSTLFAPSLAKQP